VVANSLFITGTDVDSGSRNRQKGTDKIATGKETDGNTSCVKSYTHTVKIRVKNLDNRNKENFCTRKRSKEIVCNVRGG
jgi:hypothetical protein